MIISSRSRIRTNGSRMSWHYLSSATLARGSLPPLFCGFYASPSFSSLARPLAHMHRVHVPELAHRTRSKHGGRAGASPMRVLPCSPSTQIAPSLSLMQRSSYKEPPLPVFCLYVHGVSGDGGSNGEEFDVRTIMYCKRFYYAVLFAFVESVQSSCIERHKPRGP